MVLEKVVPHNPSSRVIMPSQATSPTGGRTDIAKFVPKELWVYGRSFKVLYIPSSPKAVYFHPYWGSSLFDTHSMK